jgi:hypothetical protein
MTVLRHNFDGGPDGTAVTTANSGQVPGNTAFQVVSPTNVGSGIYTVYKDAGALNRPTAEYVLKVKVGATTADNAVIWSTAMGTQTQVWWREYIYFVSNLALMSNDMTIFESDNGAVYTGFCDITQGASPKVKIMNGPSTTSVTSTNSVPIGAWMRLEGRYKYSTTVGEAEVDIYFDADSDTPDETISATGWNMGAANSNSFAFGSAFASTNKPETYFSGLELNNVDWPGPAPFRVGRGSPNRNLSNCVAIHTAGE